MVFHKYTRRPRTELQNVRIFGSIFSRQLTLEKISADRQMTAQHIETTNKIEFWEAETFMNRFIL
uniref:Uncharacterized protein n=1 Tax=Meloidogyne enterolobii TaxID=390850 RepID=A0A6V7Y9F0_MELEN|nr:unnamed protein product [Meloidogyne enterolobii]